MRLNALKFLSGKTANKKASFPQRVGIVDIGSNSIKLRIYEIISPSSHKILYEDRNMVRLGEEVFITQVLPQAAFDKAAETMLSYSKFLDKFNINDVVVKATSAVREAQNVDDFVDYIYKKTGVVVDVLSGNEEAKYVYLASLSAMEYNGRTLMLVDIGGGSTEVCIAREDELLFSSSLPLGTVRLKEIFFPDQDTEKNYTSETIHILEAFCEKKIQHLEEIVKQYKPESILAFGGTPYNLAEVAMKHHFGLEKAGCLGFQYNHAVELYHTFIKSNPGKIAKIKGLEPKRADIVLGGALILKQLSERAGKIDIMTSDKGLREGIMMEYMFAKINPNIYMQNQDDFRLNSIRTLGEKFGINMGHGDQVNKIAQQIFEQLREIHRLGERSQYLLQAASYLHDIGMIVNYKDHHKHSFYLITQSGIPGFTQEEKEVIGLVSRYHRKSNPKNTHDAYKVLSESRKIEIAHLAAILRLADALDQSYEKNVEKIECRIQDSDIYLDVIAKSKADLTLELWSVERKKIYGQEVWQKNIVITEKKNGRNK